MSHNIMVIPSLSKIEWHCAFMINDIIRMYFRSSFDSGSQSSIPLTGDSRADADIIAFYRARQKLIQKGKLN